MMRTLYIFIGVLMLANVHVLAQDSTEVFRQIEASQNESSQARQLELAAEALELSDNYGLFAQYKASANLVQLYWKYDENYSALRTWLEISNKLERYEKWPWLIENYLLLANHYQNRKLYATAIENYKQVLALADSEHVEIDTWEMHNQIGELSMESANYEQALNAFKQAEADLEQSDGNVDRQILTHRNQARALNKLGRYWDAIQQNQKALKIMEARGKDEAYTAQLNNIGYAFQKLGVSSSALQYFSQTLTEREKLGYQDADHIPLLINIGVAYQNMNSPDEARTYLNRALEASDSHSEKAQVYDLISMTYVAQDQVILARQYNQKCLKEAQSVNDKRTESEGYYTASIIDEKSLKYAEALENYKKYKTIRDSLAMVYQADQQRLLQEEYAAERTQGEIQALIASNEIKDYEIEQLRLQAENNEKALQIQEAEVRAKLQALRIERAEIEAERKARENAILRAREENQRLQLEQQRLQEEKAKQDLQIAEEKNRNQQLQLERRRAANISMFFILLLALVLMIVVAFAWRQTRKKNKELATSRELIRQERDRSDDLLLNILPESTAEELKTYGRAAPKNYKSATVFFSDFVGFSSLSKHYSPSELIAELELFFGGFDKIISKYGIEKIKTIGDAYMCASGIPKEHDDHALRMVKASLEMLEFAAELNKDQVMRNRDPWKLRIGIHSGPVVAGVIGSNKFIYDVWGDTVNLASRLETASEPNRINISQNTLEMVKQDVRCSFRGQIEVKNMGAVRMFFVEHLRKPVNQSLK